MSTSNSRRGSALLAVLWLSAVLAAIGFSLASTVRGEAERASTAVESTRGYYLASGAIQCAILHLLRNTIHSPLEFPTGEATVEFIPEASKFNINAVSPEDLFRLLGYLGVAPEQANTIVRGVLDWRSAAGQGGSPLDQHYLSLVPSFRPRHASLEEIEELLLVQGITPDIYYGSYETVEQGDGSTRLVPRGGLSECVSVFGSTFGFDVNTAHPAVLATAGLPLDLVAEVVRRRQMALLRQEDLARLIQIAGPGASRLRVGGNTIWTIRATARVRLPNGQLSDMKRSVAAMVKIMPPGYDAPYHILRWYENAWTH